MKGKKAKLRDAESAKLRRPKFAIGGLEQDMLDWGSVQRVSATKKSDKKRRPDEVFEDNYDPEKRLKKGGKASNNSFKSKKKYKRR